jgi:hypothetical protein
MSVQGAEGCKLNYPRMTFAPIQVLNLIKSADKGGQKDEQCFI